jgi:hypothetical protein
MKKLSLFFCLLLILVGCSSRVPRIFLGDARCSIPCWYGLSPGRSTQGESQDIFRTLPFVSQSSIKTDSYISSSDYVHWQFGGDVLGEGRLYFDMQGKLYRIVLTPQGLDMGTVIDTLGVPERIWPFYRREPSGLFYHLALFYPEHGTMIEIGEKAPDSSGNGKEDISRDFNVSQIDFFAPTTIQNYLTQIARQDQVYADDVIEHLKSWPGFGQGVVQIESK